MANNNAIYNAVLSGATGGVEGPRWMSAPVSNVPTDFVTSAVALATAVDALIPATTIDNGQRNLMQAIVQGFFDNRYIQGTSFSVIAAKIVSLYNSVAAQLLPESAASSTGIVSQVSIFTFIPTQYWAAIQANTLSTAIDLGPYFQTAFDSIGNKQLTLESGTYNFATRVVNTHDKISIVGIGKVTLRATANLDTNNDGRGAIFYSPDQALRVTQVTFDINAKNTNGIYLDRCTFPIFERCSFLNVTAGYAGIRGGSVLYGIHNISSFTGPGRSVDYQKGWELVVTSSYYGCNSGLFQSTFCFTAEGFRLCGGNTCILLDSESGVAQPALRNEITGPHAAGWVFGEEIDSPQGCNISIIGGYQELAVGSATVLRGIYNNNAAVTHIFGGEYFGASAAIVDSTWLTAVDFAGITIDGNPNVKKWYYGFEGAYSGNANNNATTYFEEMSLDGSVNATFKAGTGVQPSETFRNLGGWSDIYFDHLVGLQFAMAITGVIQTVQPNGTPGDDNHKINLALTNFFQITAATPITIDSTFITNVGRAKRFTLEFTNGNVTLSNATFHLAGGVDKTYAAGNIVEFQTDAGSVIRQIGGNA